MNPVGLIKRYPLIFIWITEKFLRRDYLQMETWVLVSQG